MIWTRRHLHEAVIKALMILSTMTLVSVLGMILWTIIRRGLPCLNWALISQTPQGGFYLGQGGGVLNAILGSLVIAGGSCGLALLISLPVVLYLNVYLSRGSRLALTTRFAFDVLWGIPSIVYGAFGFTLMLALGMRASLLAGILTVTLLVLPVMSRTMDEVVRMTPTALLEVSYSLGATRCETAWRVVTRQCLPGILTAVLVAMGRGIGDAASVLFTAGFTDSLPTSLWRPVATLPLAIFFQLGTPFAKVQERAYGSALILTILILIISVTARVLCARFSKNRIH